MSEYYDHYHRWEPLAEFHFNINDSQDEFDDDNFLYCLCSRAYIRDNVKTYYVEKEDGSESDMEVLRDTGSQGWEDQSHVHFSLDTSYKVKCEKDEGASCYCSASHTDNCCSTDEHDAAQMHGTTHALQPSDSGADLTYQDCHSENTNPDKLERMDQDFPNPTEENYLSESTWDKFWAINGERLIWASWIKKYSDYINPAYLTDNNELVVDDNNIPKQRSVDQIYRETEPKNENYGMRERKFSYDSKVNPYKKGHSQNQTEKLDKSENKDESWPPSRRRSCSEHERIVSPRTFAATDSMTNVTKITLSSYDVTSSHVTSESTPTDDYSVSSTTSDDQSNDQTRIANVENADPTSVDDMDTDQYWQFLWKKHFGEQYALHYANYIENQNSQDSALTSINIEVTISKENETKRAVVERQDTQDSATLVLDIECENSEGNSQDVPTINEVQAQVDEMKLQEPGPKPRKRGKKKSNKYFGSVGVLLQSLLKDEVLNDNNKVVEVTETGEDNGDTKDKEAITENIVISNSTNIQQSASNINFTSYSYDDGDDDPPEETSVNLKRSHEIDDEEAASEKIKATFEIMGFSVEDNNIPKGQVVYRKNFARLRPPRYKTTKKFGMPRKTYFDDEGNPILDQSKDSQDEREIKTDEDLACPDFTSEALRLLNVISQNNPEKDKEQNDKTTNNTEEVLDEINFSLEDAQERNKDQNVSEDMNIDTNESTRANDAAIKKIEDETKIKDPSNGIETNTQLYNKNNEDMSVDTNDSANENINTNSNSSTNEEVVEKESMEEEVILKDGSTFEEMNVDSNNSDLKVAINNKTKEAMVGSEIVNKATEIKDEIKYFHDYDVQNKVESSVSDETNALEASGVPLPDDLDQSSDETKPEAVDTIVAQNVESTKRRRRQKRYAKLDGEELSNIPPELRDQPKMMKYWKKRHSLFHRFDEGIRLDRESWFSVTPENVARHIARKYTYDTVLDAFCGAGGNTIQFAYTSKKVIAIDIDPAKIEMARHNASVYGVDDRIQFIVGDFFELAPTLEADMVFLSPPWGGPNYSNNVQYDLETMLLPKPASELMSVARTISPIISLYLPRNSRPDQILTLAKEVGGSVEVEQSYLDKRFVAITAYFY